MPELEKDVHVPPPPLSEAQALLEQLREKGEPVVLTINGTVRLTIRDNASLDRLCDLVDRLETIEAVQEALEDVRAGRVRSLEEMKAEKRTKYGLSD